MSANVFRPVKSTEARLFSNADPVSPQEGYLYFTTDTKKIYLGTNGEYLPMGGNSGVYYGNRIPEESEADSENTTFRFIISTEIEGTNIPNVDDLLLNIPDGCFYRITIVNADEDSLTAEKLTVAGSGGGGGGGGSSSSRPVVNGLNDNDTYFSAAAPEKMKITFNCSSQLPENNYIDTIEYKLGSQTFYINDDYEFGATITIDLSQHLDILSTSAANTLQVQAFDAYGNSSYVKSLQFYVLNLSLKSSRNSIESVQKGSYFLYQYTPVGGSGSSSALSRYLSIEIAPLNNPYSYIYSVSEPISATGTQLTVNIPFNDEKYGFEHGVYILYATYCVKIERTQDIIKSNTLQHQIVYIDTAETDTPLIATSFIDGENITQYSKYSMDYMVACGSVNKDITVQIQVGNDVIEENAKFNEIGTWEYTFTGTGTYPIEIGYDNNKKQKLGSLNVVEYSSDEVPTVNTTLLEFQLSPLGKTNSQSNKEEWISNYNGGRFAAKFENFLWGNENGWMTDDDGPHLKLTNGAKLTIPNYRPFEKNSTNGGFTIEIDFKLSKVSDYKQGLIKCLSYTTIDNATTVKTGFQITGEKATLNSETYKATVTEIQGDETANGTVSDSDAALQSFTQYYNEDTKIHLTYVIEDLTDKNNKYHFVYTYLNGVLSGIMEMSATETFQDTSLSPALIEIDSTYGDISIYGIRTYRQAITHQMAINDYNADIYNIDTKIAVAKNNKVFNDSSKVSKEVIDNLASTLGVKYCIFEGGYPMPKKFTDSKTYDSTTLERALPTSKTDYRFVSFKMCEKIEGQETKVLMDVPMQLGPDATDNSNDIYGDEAIEIGTPYYFKRGVQLYGQGTSSMVYPVKNLRLKFIDEQDYPTVYKGSIPVQIVCFKADYMDSSSTHNTCTGNLVYDLYNNLGLKTPPQKFGADYDIVTAIKGFPIICFYKNYSGSGANDDGYTYIGRYNFNLDKATPEPFGFLPVYKYTGNTTSSGRKEVEVCGFRTEQVEGMTVLPLDAEGNEVFDDIIQCWEFLNNDTTSPTKFLTPSSATSYDQALTNSWSDYYEDRYPDKYSGMVEDKTFDTNPEAKEAVEKGLFRMSKWVNSTCTTEVTNAKLDTPVYYLTLDEDIPTEGITYYDSNHSPQSIQKIDSVKYEVNYTGENDVGLDKSAVSVNVAIFATKIKAQYGDNAYNSYSFNLLNGVWSMTTVIGKEVITIDNVSLSDYGITTMGSLYDGQSITAELVIAYSNWTPSVLYEKHEYDNARYRLAKFKNEFTEYFDMDFSLFYYILTLTLLMMDSRAKNMMMASWDMKIWYPIFYDMDTILGLNNTGFNKFSYDTEDDPEDKVFNGFDSVLWNNFREVFVDEITTFYNKMRDSNQGNMTVAKLLDTYNTNGADAYNEALTTMDAVYKYEKPYEEGYKDGANDEWIKPGSVNYLYAAQGRRSNHRSWWITNRLNYLDSKYKPLSYGSSKPSQSEAFSFRAYAMPTQKSTVASQNCIKDVPANHKFDIAALANSYQSLFVGNIVYGPVYTTAGSIATIGPDSPKHEVESYILNPSLIKDLGDLSDKYIGSWQMPSNKLTSLRFGRSSRSHPNNYKTYFNSLLTQLNLGTSTPYLKELNVARCTGLKSLDLEDCSKLETLDAEGCGLTGIVFPEDSILQKLYLPSTLSNLQITNQSYLDTIVFDDIPKNMTKLYLKNVPQYDGYELANSLFNIHQGKNQVDYVLTNINWKIPFEDGTKVDTIPFLDMLIQDGTTIKPAENYSRETALTGVITLTGNITGDEYQLYRKYKKYFPDLAIAFESAGISKANTITFMSDEQGSENNTIHYQVLTDGKQSLELLTSRDGPTGKSMSAPSKTATVEYTYSFTGRWYTENGEYYAADADALEGDKKFSEAIPLNNLTLYPKYDAVLQKYEVTFYDHNGKVIGQENESGAFLSSWEVEYGSLYNGPMVNYYYRDESNLPATRRYKFLGWGDRAGDNPIYFDLSTEPIVGMKNLYAHFVEEDVTNSSPEEYFTVETDSQTCKTETSATISLRRKYISIKPKYKTWLQGKITIPASVEGDVVTGIGDFSNMPYITHIYFAPAMSQECDTIGKNAFANGEFSKAYTETPKLITVSLPSSIRYILESAFVHQTELQTVNFNNNIKSIGSYSFYSNTQLKLASLPEELEYLGVSAFALCGSNVSITSLPEKLTVLFGSVFANSEGIRLESVGVNDNISKIEGYSFFSTSKKISIDTFEVGKTVKTLGENCFGADSYIAANTNSIKFAYAPRQYNNGSYDNDTELLNYLGFTEDNLDNIKSIAWGEEGSIEV